MPTATERYHHGNLRAALVTEATTLARAEGPAGLSLREVARRVGVSHNAAYRHFADRDALLRAVAEVGLRELMAAMRGRQAAVTEVDPVERARLRLMESGRAYVLFALGEPGLFSVAFSAYPHAGSATYADDAVHDRHDGHAPHDEADPFGVLLEALDDLVTVGYLPVERRPGAELTCWSTMHGFAVLHLDGPLRGSEPDQRDADLQRVLDSIDRGLASTPRA